MLTELFFLSACEKIKGNLHACKKYQTYWQGSERAAFFSRLSHAIKSSLIIELGAGNGGLAMGLYVEGYHHYIGLDNDPACTAFCRDTFTNEDDDFIFDGFGRTMDGAIKYPIPDWVADCIIAFDFFTRIGDYWLAESHIEEMRRISNPFATVLTTWYFDDEAGLTPTRAIFSKAVIKQLFFKLRAEIINEEIISSASGQQQTAWVITWQN